MAAKCRTQLWCMLLAVGIALPLLAQQPLRDRRRWLAPGQAVSDDPRRVPVPPTERVPATIVVRGGRILRGTGAAPHPGTLVIKGNRITAILLPDQADWPADARIIDANGKTVMPGLIDLHTHLAYRLPRDSDYDAASDVDSTLRAIEKLRYFLESGITSVRDVGSRGDVPFRLKQWVSEHRLAGPRVFAAGHFLTATGGHGAEGMSIGTDVLDGGVLELSGPDAWRNAVRREFKHGADLIKIGSHFSRAEVAAAVEEAHALGIKVTCDCETFYIDWAVEAGVDGIEHPLPRTDAIIAEMAKRHVAADPTLVAYILVFAEAGGYFGSTSRSFGFSVPANLEVVRRMKSAGIKIGIGTDLVSDWYRYLPNAYILELKQMVAAGYSTLDVLTMATKINAEILDMDDKLGTLEPGKLADVIIVKGEPEKNLDDLAHVDTVIRDGEVVVANGRIAAEAHRPQPLPALQIPADISRRGTK